MSRIASVFARLKSRGEKGLVAYLTAGFPTVRMMPDLVRACEAGGADVLEIGIPFSDPLADGPTIQAASQRALRQGVSTAGVLETVARLRRSGVGLPLALMSYYNPIWKHGVDRFCREAVLAGADGLIVPDLPPEEGSELIPAARRRGIDTIFLAAPTSPKERLARIARASTGFLYYVSRTGVTGASRSLPAEVGSQVQSICRITDLPVCVGFGISRPDQVAEVTRFADGAVIGSALLDIVGRGDGRAAARTERFLKRLKHACGG